MNRSLIRLCLLLLSSVAFAQSGKDGNFTISAPNTVVNEFSYLTSNVSVGSFTVSVANSTLNTNGHFASALASGDLVMLIQMQGATIDNNVTSASWGNITSYNTCGNYQFLEVASVPSATSIEFTCPVEYDFSSSGKTQVIRVPRYNSLTINAAASLITDPWNGTIGGVCAVEVLGNTIINAGALIDVSGLGFRGGVADNNSSLGQNTTDYATTNTIFGAQKGESIAGYTTEYDLAGGSNGNGAPANGGGGGSSHNTGGGGGANGGNVAAYNGLGNPDNSGANWNLAWNLESPGFSTNTSSGGGKGGYGFCYSDQNAIVLPPGDPAWGGDRRKNNGGRGGRPLDYSGGRIFLGGGGGAGDGNDTYATDGGKGGGLFYLLSYGSVSGGGSIIANGLKAADTQNDGGVTAYGIDAPGGGGGGGTVILRSVGAITGVSVTANGGAGGNQSMTGMDIDNDGLPNEEAEGPGGGGGGGYIAISNGTIARTTNGGINGVTNAVIVAEFPPNGATAGGIGTPDASIDLYTYTLVPHDTIVCYNNPATINANVNTADPLKPTIIWYDATSNGTVINTGNSYTTPPLTKDTTFYLKICTGKTVSFSTPFVPIKVTVVPQPTATTIQTNLLCFNDSSGQILLNTTGGTSAYNYSWSNGATTSSLTNVHANTYSVFITDANGCTTTATAIITQPTQLLAAISGSDATCGSLNGTAAVNVSGGVLTYTYLWNNNATTSSLSNIGAGLYSLTITDANGCTNTSSVTINNSGAPTLTSGTPTNVSCFGLNDGAAFVNASGGTTPYAYSWAPAGGNASSATGLGATIYSVTITDANNCTATSTVNITQPADIVVSLTQNNATCNLMNGSLVLTVSGGTTSYTYLWNNAETTASISNISIGTYSMVITDANGCTKSTSATITQPALPTAQISNVVNTSCGNNNGSAVIESLSGTQPYTYSWINTGISQAIGTNLAPGTYSAVVVDANGCSDTASVQILPSTPPLATYSATETPECSRSCVNFSSGTLNVSYSWTFEAGATSTLQNPQHCYLATGSYPCELIVTDAVGCKDTVSFIQNATLLVNPVASFTSSSNEVSSLAPQFSFTNLSLNADSWIWDFGDNTTTSTEKDPTHIYDNEGVYCVLLEASTVQNCVDTERVCVKVVPEFAIYVPNTFTPDGDGKNDLWTPLGFGIDDSHYELIVFDRWGNEIWKTNQWGQGWNGKANSGTDIAQIDTYVWLLFYRDKVKYLDHTMNGHVNIIK